MKESDGKTGVVGEVLIASFGEARLLRVDGALRLTGGSMADRMEALEWVAMFMPEERVEGWG